MRDSWQLSAAVCHIGRNLLCGLLIIAAGMNVTARAAEIVIYAADAENPNEQPVPQVVIGVFELELDVDAVNPPVAWACFAGAIDYADHFRPTLECELAFVRQVCGELTVDERRQIKIAGEIALRDAAKRYGKSVNPKNVEQVAVVEGAADTAVEADAEPDIEVEVEPAVLIREALAGAVRHAVAPDTNERFAFESAQRVARRKRAAIIAFVACVDRLVCLSREQRDELMTSLSAEWQTSWESWIQMSDSDSAWIPRAPDERLQCLNAAQMAVWKDAPKLDGSVTRCTRSFENEDDEWWGAGLTEFVPRTLNLVEAVWHIWVPPAAEDQPGPVAMHGIVAPAMVVPIVVAEPQQ